MARNGLKAILIIAPIVFAAAGAVFAVSVYDYSASGSRSFEFTSTSMSMLDVYRISILRVVPYLPFIVGPLAIVLDIVGDVAFFVHPGGSSIATRDECRERFTKALDHAAASGTVEEIQIWSHSQGSVIVFDALASWNPSSASRGPTVRLFTMGSPIRTLYGRFLGKGSGLDLGRELPLDEWVNLYRVDDYVGGQVGEDKPLNMPGWDDYVGGKAGQALRGGRPIDVKLGPGGHGDYWSGEFIKGIRRS